MRRAAVAARRGSASRAADAADLPRRLRAGIVPRLRAAHGVHEADREAASVVGAAWRRAGGAATSGRRVAARAAAVAAEDVGCFRAGRVPLFVAAEAVKRADGRAAEFVRAGWRGLGGAAASSTRLAAADAAHAADLGCLVRAHGVPLRFAAERVHRADGVAAGGVVAGGPVVRHAACACDRAPALVRADAAVFDRKRRAACVPLDVAAEAVGGAHRHAAGRIGAGRGRVRLAAVPGGRVAAANAADAADDLRVERALRVPLRLAAERVDRAESFAAVGVVAPRLVVWNAAVAAVRVAAGIGADAADLFSSSGAVLIPLAIAAEGILRAHDRAAGCVRAGRRRLRCAAVASVRIAATDAADATVGLRRRGAHRVPARGAAEGVGRADRLAAVRL